MQAHDLYLRGRYFWNKRSGEGIRNAAGYFEQAIGQDPDYALAYVRLADALALRSEYEEVPAPETLPKAKAAAACALQLDPGLAEAHASLGLIAHFDFDHQAAIKESRAALELKPDFAMASKWYADELAITGRQQEARGEFERALRDDPTSLIINYSAASAKMYAGDYEGAAALFRKTLEMDPAFPPAHMGPQLYALQGRYDEALAGELEGGCAGEHVSRAHLGGLWLSLGEKDKGFALLREACSSKDLGLMIWSEVASRPRISGRYAWRQERTPATTRSQRGASKGSAPRPVGSTSARSRRRSNARARCSLVFTVAGSISRQFAVSSIESSCTCRSTNTVRKCSGSASMARVSRRRFSTSVAPSSGDRVSAATSVSSSSVTVLRFLRRRASASWMPIRVSQVAKAARPSKSRRCAKACRYVPCIASSASVSSRRIERTAR